MKKGMIFAPLLLTSCMIQPVITEIDLDECDLIDTGPESSGYSETYQCSGEPVHYHTEGKSPKYDSEDLATTMIRGPI